MFAKLQSVAARYDELGDLLSSPDTLADMERWTRLSRERAELEPVALGYKAYEQKRAEMEAAAAEAQKETGEMKELLEEEVFSLKNRLAEMEKQLKILLLPKDKNDERGCTLEIRAGAGGEEAALFAYDLYRMYMAYCERRRFRWEVVDLNETELGGMKEAIVNIGGKGAYARLKYESGVHRVQRVPETESQGRIHTSTVTVAVLPEAEEVDVKLDEKDVRVDLFRSSGAGGQKVNKTETAIRLTHFPTGIVVTCQDERSQLKNKEKAFKVLRSRLYDMKLKEQNDEISAERRSQVGSGDRSERIRTYNFPQGRVTDHRIGMTIYKLDSFLDGEIDEIIDGLITSDQAEKMKNF